MPSTLTELVSKGLATPNLNGLEHLIQYEVYVGSSAYAINSDTSDMDVISWAIPPKDMVFPHLQGYVPDFLDKPKSFEKGYQQHHMNDKNALGGKGRVYDYTCHGIVKYFRLLLTANPTVVETLFVPLRCIMYTTPIGNVVRDRRHMFLSKKMLHTCSGYAWEQLHKLRIKTPTEESKRHALVEQHGYDTKFATHVVRLVDQCYQVLTEGDMDIERNAEKLRAIRRGEVTLEWIDNYFKEMEPILKQAAETSKLPWGADVTEAKKLLLDCLEEHFGSLSGAVVREDAATSAIKEIEDVLTRYNSRQRVAV